MANLDIRRDLSQIRSRRHRDDIRKLCREDIFFWIDAFVWTYNPRLEKKVLPFCCWDFQEHAVRIILEHIMIQRDLVCEKSRDQGASWLFIIVFDWLQRFHEDVQLITISRDREMVDSPKPDSLFWKLDHIKKYVPDWLNPNFYRVDSHRGNLDNASVITGYATTKKAAIGGRATAILLDEFSRMDGAIEIRDGTADVADCRFFVSTHTGPQTAFNGLCSNGVTDKLVMHWTDHPEKRKGLYRYIPDGPKRGQIEILDKADPPDADYPFVYSEAPTGGPKPGLRSPWYDAEALRRGSSRAVAMDLDIDVSGTQKQFFDPLLITKLVRNYCRDADWEGEIEYDHDTGSPITLRRERGGHLRLWCPLLDGKPKPMDIAMGGDVSQGTGATPSCLSLINRQTGEKVAEYANANVDPKLLAFTAYALGHLFKSESEWPAYFIWEKTGPGAIMGGKLLELGYNNIYWFREDVHVRYEAKRTDQPGWIPTDQRTFDLLCDYREALATGDVVNRSKMAVEECRQFVYTKDGMVEHALFESKEDPSGSKASHGDRVIADALAWKGAKGVVKRLMKEEKQKEQVPLLSIQHRLMMEKARRRP